MVWSAGQQLQNGRYFIEKVLGHGRFGVTYLAREKNGELVVIKIPNDESFNSPDFERLQEVFVKEAVKLAKCKHSHIVKAKEPFQENGLWCIVMEYIDGVDLASRAQSILPEEEALRYIQQIGEALIEVHNNNLLHRDVRPQNIMVRAGKPEAVLIDFGLALDFDHNLTKIRSEEISKGFAPLELYSSQVEKGAYTDIYFLGATLYVLLTGQKPADAMERKVNNVRLIPPKEINPQISKQVNRAILEAMELEAKARPQSMEKWLDSLGFNSTSSISTNETNNSSSQRKINWNIVWVAVAAIGTLLAGIGIPQIIEIWSNKSTPPSPNPTSTTTP